MPKIARVLSTAAWQTSASLARLSRHSDKYLQGLAKRIRQVVEGADAADWRFLGSARSYQLREPRRVGKDSVRLARIGAVFGDAEFSRRVKDGIGTASSAYLGFYQVAVPRHVDIEDLVRRWFAGEPHHKLPAKWISSPFAPELWQGRRPVRIAIHHGEKGFVVRPRPTAFGSALPDTAYGVDEDDLVDLLRQDEYLRRALDRNRDAPVWLSGCEISYPAAEKIARGLDKTLYFSTGANLTFPAEQILQSDVPFALTRNMQLDFLFRLANAPGELVAVGEVHGWSALAAFVKADPQVPAIQMVTPR